MTERPDGPRDECGRCHRTALLVERNGRMDPPVGWAKFDLIVTVADVDGFHVASTETICGDCWTPSERRAYAETILDRLPPR